MTRIFRLISFLALCFVLIRCAGGSSGTGTRTVSGNIRENSGAPLSDIEVELLESGATTKTNSEGDFSLDADAGATSLTLEVKAPSGSKEVKLDNLNPEGSAIDLSIEVNPNDQSLAVDNVEMLAKVVGNCDIYFENFSVIRQANSAPQGVSCTAKVWIKSNGNLAPDVSFAVQHRGCHGRDKLTTDSVGITRSGANAGVGQTQFSFFDDSEHCVYRIVAPFPFKRKQRAVTELHTFTKQEFDSVSSK